MKLKMTICVFICFFLAACATRIDHPAAPKHQQSVVENFELDKNESRVHFFSGELFLKNHSGIKMNESAEFYVNDVKIGKIGNNKEYIAIDLLPGSYNFKWMPIGSGSESCVPEPLTLSISDSELIFLIANMRDASSTAPGAYLFGAIGAVLGTDVKVISFFEPDIGMRDKINEYKLISLIESFKRTYSIDKTEPAHPSIQNSTSTDVEEKLIRLKEIYNKGLITKEEYDEKRRELLEKL